VASRAQLHAELIRFFRQHCPVCDERHLTVLAWMVAGLLLSQTVCFDHWKAKLPMVHCLAASWQRRCRRWLGNQRISVDALYGPLVLWAIQHWQKPCHSLYLALDTTVLWNHSCVVALSMVCHGRAIPLLWQTLEHPSASVSAEVVIGLLQRADRLLADCPAITLLADRGFPSAELLGWFEGRERWSYVMRLRGDAEIHGTAAPLGCQVRRLQLPRGHCRGYRDVQLWGDGQRRANLVLARPVGIKASEPWYLVSNRDPTLDLVWAYGQRFCCEQLFRDQKSGIFQLENSRLRDPARIDRLLLVVAIAVLISSLQGYAVSLSGQRQRVDPHWKRGLSFARIGLHWLQQSVMATGRALLTWLPIPLQSLEPCIPSRGVRRRQNEPWFTRVALPPPLPITITARMAVA
jgi:Transposase DDE domain